MQTKLEECDKKIKTATAGRKIKFLYTEIQSRSNGIMEMVNLLATRFDSTASSDYTRCSEKREPLSISQ